VHIWTNPVYLAVEGEFPWRHVLAFDDGTVEIDDDHLLSFRVPEATEVDPAPADNVMVIIQPCRKMTAVVDEAQLG